MSKQLKNNELANVSGGCPNGRPHVLKSFDFTVEYWTSNTTIGKHYMTLELYDDTRCTAEGKRYGEIAVAWCKANNKDYKTVYYTNRNDVP